MKFEKLLLAAALLCLVSLSPSCSDDDPAADPEKNETPGGGDTPEEPEGPDTPDTPELTKGVKVEGYYKGDYHDEGTATSGSISRSKTRTIPKVIIFSASISTIRWQPIPISRSSRRGITR